MKAEQREREERAAIVPGHSTKDLCAIQRFHCLCNRCYLLPVSTSGFPSELYDCRQGIAGLTA